MNRPPQQLRNDALTIWQAGVEAVRSEGLVRKAIQMDGGKLFVAGAAFDLSTLRRIVVVGAGKAGAGMAAGLEEALGPRLAKEKHLQGWINVPADCVRPLQHIYLHPARPAGLNEPTEAGVQGSLEILRLAGSLAADDLCLALISGGGSALLPAPAEGITLADKLAVTRHLAAAGANIRELNTVRKQLSRIKGGGLARACRAGRLIALVISDVPGDPLDLIASGPTVEDHSTAVEALAVLERYNARQAGISNRVFDHLSQAAQGRAAGFTIPVSNLVIGDNRTAVEAAAKTARGLGYQAQTESAIEPEGPAEEVGRSLAERALAMRAGTGPNCLISGGEPVVKLVDAAERGLGGRNQQLVLAALKRLRADGSRGIAILSGGTDGEDGPTDAAGAVLDAQVIAAATTRGLDPSDYLRRNDAYHFFEPLGTLIKTGPTHTNVCDLRVALVERDKQT